MTIRLDFPIGTSDFEKIRLSQAEYVDKTMLIADILRNSMEVLLFPRPRRFGKTLNLSMLRYFLDIRKKSAGLFAGLAIESQPEFVHLNRYPVIFLSFKDIKFGSLADATIALQQGFADLYREHDYLLTGLTREEDRIYFKQVQGKVLSLTELSGALRFLMQLLAEQTQQKVVVLLDEYDTPIHASHFHGYYNEMVNFMRALMGAAFKDNSNLFKGVITGILRVAKEGMFSGLNNLDVYSLLSDAFAQYFGFTQPEVDGLLAKTEQPQNRQLVRDWYNGFQFGTCEIYNPWSMINYFSKGGELKPYWAGTSDNALVKQIVAEGSGTLKADFEVLLQGGEVVRTIDEFVILPELFSKEDTAFGLLLFSGYLKVTTRISEDASYRCTLRIPNQEIKALFNGFFKTFFDVQRFTQERYHVLLQSLVTGESEVFQDYLEKYLAATFSYFDVNQQEPERFYHGFVLGLLVSLQDTHSVKSNRESGLGRYDVMIIPKDPTQLATLIEFKVVRKVDDLDRGIELAFQQIAAKGYAQELKALGITRIQTIAMVFCGKEMRLVVR